MALVHDRCICLRKTEYSETSQILTLFSREYGIVRVIAKGAHRRTKAGASQFDGGIDFLDIGQAVFGHDPARDLPPLTEWRLTEGQLGLRKTLRGIYLGLYAAELVGRLIEEHDPHPELFDRVAMALTDLATARREENFLAFEIDLLRESGYLPELFVCASCTFAIDGRETVFFSPRRGGIVCRNCQGTVHDCRALDGRLLRLLQTILRLPRQNGAVVRLPQLTRHQTDPLNAMLSEHIENTLGKRLRMPKWVLG
ncbi:MAG TPA: DNA repair protein RecO [Tepidisphaeraceae bacterium]|jgi:DNA repair protein RecO (recombination protein O)|nr:DNA repair protein RecO [Tepidisphaeraceae bacterium]